MLNVRAGKITPEFLDAIADFFNDAEIDLDWWQDHLLVELDENTRTIRLTVHKINCQEFNWISEEISNG